MRLHDLFSVARPFELQTGDGRIHLLKGAREVAAAVAAAPLRYVLDDASVRVIARSAFEADSMLGASVDLLRVPADRIWIEWSDKESMKFLKQRQIAGQALNERPPRKIGVLIDSDESGRSGEVRMSWLGEEGEVELSPFIAEFDFDNPYKISCSDARETVRHVHMPGVDALDPFFACVRYRLEPGWNKYYQKYCSSPDQFDEAISIGLSSVGGDFPIAAAFLLILSTRAAFEERPTQFTKLNAKRAKRGREPLLDHVEIRLNLSSEKRSGWTEHGDRTSPRLHHVSGHLVRRGQQIFWRKAHLRGNPDYGVVAAKTIAVTASPISRAA